MSEENSETPKEMSRRGGFGMGDVTNPIRDCQLSLSGKIANVI